MLANPLIAESNSAFIYEKSRLRFLKQMSA